MTFLLLSFFVRFFILQLWPILILNSSHAFFKKFVLLLILLIQICLAYVFQMQPNLLIRITQSWRYGLLYLRSSRIVPVDELLDSLLVSIIDPSVFNSLFLFYIDHRYCIISYELVEFVVFIFL